MRIPVKATQRALGLLRATLGDRREQKSTIRPCRIAILAWVRVRVQQCMHWCMTGKTLQTISSRLPRCPSCRPSVLENQLSVDISVTADLIDNANDWVRLSIEIPLEARLSSWLPSVLENQLPERGNSTKARLNRKHVRVCSDMSWFQLSCSCVLFMS